MRWPPPPSSTPLTTLRTPQPGFSNKTQPKQQTTHGSKQQRETAAQLSRTQLRQKSNRVASHPNTTTTTLNPHLLPEKAGSAHHSSKRISSKGAWQQVTPIDDVCHTHVSHKWLYHLDACAGSVLTPYDYISNVQKKDWATGSTRALVNAVCVDHSWTLISSMVKPAAPLKPPEDTTLVASPSWEDYNLLIWG